MERIVYNALCNYFHALEVKGYMPYRDSQKALILSFYWDYIYNDPGHILSRKEYMLVERALDCLYGSTCLIPYPDYLKMGKLHLGQMEEIDARLKAVENAKVVKGKNHIQNITDIDLSGWDEIDDEDEPVPTPTPTPSEVIAKTYQSEHYAVHTPELDIDDEVFFVPFKDIADIYNAHGNCTIRSANGAVARIDCYSWDYIDGDTQNIGPEEHFGTGIFYTPYQVNDYDYGTLTHSVYSNPGFIFVDYQVKINELYLTYTS